MNIKVYHIEAALKELREWSPEGDSADFDRLLKTIAYNVKVGQYDANDTIITFE
jgi:hypothetical protein